MPEKEGGDNVLESSLMNRRQFLAWGAGGIAALVVGGVIPGVSDNPAFAATTVQQLKFRITDAIKEMATHNAVNDARCYFWIFKEERFPAECPGPVVFTRAGRTVRIEVRNDLDEPHALTIPGMFTTGPIPPGRTFRASFVAGRPGTYLYYDHLNAPVNRVMGLHGAFVVMPNAAKPGNKFTPYAPTLVTRPVQRLFNDLGSSAWYPGLAWHQGDPATDTPAFRQYVWVLHQASPKLFEEVGSLPAGQLFPAATFVDAFAKDPFTVFARDSRIPQYFTINGQSGHFTHNNPYICPNNRVGEPVIIRVLNAGLWTHSMHIHANHVYVIARNGRVSANPIWVDTFNALPLETFDWLVPYMRPPDIPNARGIGMPDQGLPTAAGRTWPPTEELGTFIPPVGTRRGGLPIHVQQSPLCFPMHDHSEPSQTAQGGNYNMGLISGLNFTGDRTTPGGVTTFPNAPTLHGPSETGPAAGPEEA